MPSGVTAQRGARLASREPSPTFQFHMVLPGPAGLGAPELQGSPGLERPQLRCRSGLPSDLCSICGALTPAFLDGAEQAPPSVQPVTGVPWWGPSGCAAGAGSRTSLRQRARLRGCVSCCCNKPRDRGASPAGAVLSVSPASFVGLTLPPGHAAPLALGASPRPPGTSPVSVSPLL